MSYAVVATTAFTAFSQIQQGRAGAQQANIAAGQTALQAQQSETRAAQLEYQGQVERDTSMETARIIRRAGRAQIGQTRAGYAGAGVVVGQGSSGEVERQQTIDVEHDAYQTLLEGDRRARALTTDAQFSRSDADITRADAQMLRGGGLQREAAGLYGAVGSVLAGGQMALRSSGWRTAGPGFSGTQAPAPVEYRGTDRRY